MRAAQISELKNRLSHYLRLVRRGETVTVLDRGHAVAQIMPVETGDEELGRLVGAGLVRLPLRQLPKDFYTRKLPRASASVIAALEAEREDRF